jgi:hypothetical protein
MPAADVEYHGQVQSEQVPHHEGPGIASEETIALPPLPSESGAGPGTPPRAYIQLYTRIGKIHAARKHKEDC